MPTGVDAEEQEWFTGWYRQVIEPAIISANLTPMLAANQVNPVNITDDIRTHLAYDAIMIVDLGGRAAEDEPNPNVMYEFGIRHALDLPTVLLAWQKQRLPFDVYNQRAIMTNRAPFYFKLAMEQIVNHIESAKAGDYYRPMEAITRAATIKQAAASGTESLLRALAQEVADLKDAVLANASKRRLPTVGGLNRSSLVNRRVKRRMGDYRPQLYLDFIAHGGLPKDWQGIIRATVSKERAEAMSTWSLDEWQNFVRAHAQTANEDAVGMDH